MENSSHGKNFSMLSLGRKINAERISSNHLHASENSSHRKNLPMLSLGIALNSSVKLRRFDGKLTS